jgi:hypothetical protein|tara:strand:- start:159 stop:368 length:210 start_codon:yes stop_codon:yes gene_type:complete
MVKFNKNDFKDWGKFRLSERTTITREEFKLVCYLHSKYYLHKYNEPCTCSPKIINKWISELNAIWNNGY